MTEFTKDCLRFCVRAGNDRPETFNIATANNPDANIASLAAFALAQMERAENAEATVKDYLTVQAELDASETAAKMYAARTLAAEERAEDAEAERDDAIERWARRAKEAEARLASAEAERGRLKKELKEALTEQEARQRRAVIEARIIGIQAVAKIIPTDFLAYTKAQRWIAKLEAKLAARSEVDKEAKP